MKILVTAKENSITSEVDPHFGRCAYFIVADVSISEIHKWEAVKNPASAAAHGAGFQAMQQVSDLGAQVVLTGSLGPNAFGALQKMDIKAFQATGRVDQAIEAYLAGKLEQLAAAGKAHAK